MGHQVVKADPRIDLYIDWSSVVEAPVFVGTRQQILEWLTSDFKPGTERFYAEVEHAKDRLNRADDTGSSAYKPFGVFFDGNGLIYQQRGLLLRKDFLVAAVLWERCEDIGEVEPFIEKLLKPFEED